MRPRDRASGATARSARAAREDPAAARGKRKKGRLDEQQGRSDRASGSSTGKGASAQPTLQGDRRYGVPLSFNKLNKVNQDLVEPFAD